MSSSNLYNTLKYTSEATAFRTGAEKLHEHKIKCEFTRSLNSYS